MTNLIPLQLDKDTGNTVASRQGLSGGVNGFLSVSGFVHIEAIANTTWVVTHNANSIYFQVQVFSTTGELILPDIVTTIDNNTVEISFGTATTGHATFALFT